MNDKILAGELIRVARLLVTGDFVSPEEKKRRILEISSEIRKLYHTPAMGFTRAGWDQIFDAIDSGKGGRISAGYYREEVQRGYSDSSSWKDNPVMITVKPSSPDKVWMQQPNRFHVEIGTGRLMWDE